MVETKYINSKSFTATNTFRSAATITVLVFCLSAAHGENLTTLDGRTFTNVYSVTNYSSVVVIRHDGGMTGVKPSNLPEDFRAKYGIKIQTNSVIAADDKDSSQLRADDLFLAQHLDNIFSSQTNISFNVTNRFNIVCEHDCVIEVNPNGFEFSIFSRPVLANEEKYLLSERLEFLENNKYSTKAVFSFKFGEEKTVEQIFKKFIQWQETAAKNNAVPFNKEIANIPDNDSIFSKRSFEFQWDGEARLNVNYELSAPLTGYGFLEKDDAVVDCELLKTIPSLKKELIQNIQKQEAQKDLFK